MGEPLQSPDRDAEAVFRAGPHGREYLAGRAAGAHPGTGEGRGRNTPPIRPAHPGPGPGGRPVMPGGPGGPVGPMPTPNPPPARSGMIGYLMPIYTIGIIIFFVYTAMKVKLSVVILIY